ncbi:MAG: DNA/RNA non-specific endonuclease [Gemmatimonadaceae bacterium]
MRTRPRSAALVLLAALSAACTERSPVAPTAVARHDVGITAIPPVRFSEFHYDNTGADVGESIEISGPAGTDLAGYSVVLYNGNGGALYNAGGGSSSLTLSGTIPANCTVDPTRGVIVLTVVGLQNGDPDGFALVNSGSAVEFLSYGGTFTATNGVAAGLLSSDVGVKEATNTLVGQSLQRDGAGTWSGPKASTFGACNDDGAAPPAAVVASVVVSPATPSIAVGATQQFTATALDASNQPVAGVSFRWSSGAPTVATITPAGVASGVDVGASLITATAPNSVSGTANLTVTSVPPPVSLPATRFTEIHYDNVATDVNERIEIEGPAGTDLTGWTLVLYNGTNGASYNTFILSGTISSVCTDPTRGVIVVSYPQDGIQNGSPDGFALVDNNNQVVEFLSYEGVFVAANGPASGIASTDIIALENSAPLGQSLKRSATGVWQAPSTANFGACNGGGGTALSNSSIAFTGRSALNDPPLPVGFEDQLFGDVRDATGSVVTTTLAWISETPAIASIDQRGVMTALAVGNAQFRATSADGTISATYILPTTIATAGNAQYAGNAEFGEPKDGSPADDYILRRTEYTSSFSNVRNTPNWVSYDIDVSVFGPQDRCDCFTYDPLLPQSFTRYNTADYTGAGAAAGYGIDRGHLARSFDRTSGSLDNAHSFLFSNIVPQAADVNQGPWANMENFLGNLASAQNKEVYVIAGVAGNKGTIKNEGVIVIPDFLWKIAVVMPRDQGLANVINGTKPEIIAVIMPNIQGVVSVDWNTYRTTVDAVEALSGYDLLALLPDSIEAQLESGNHFPVPNIGGPYSGNEGQSIAFSASGTTDADAGDDLTYAWTFGDNRSATGISPLHVFVNNGTYTVTLKVTDQHGAQTTATTAVTILNTVPVLTATPPASWLAGISKNVGVSFTDANPKDGPFIMRINWGDGSAVSTYVTTVLPVAALQRPHTYAASGAYLITITVTDKDAGVGTTTLTVVVP